MTPPPSSASSWPPPAGPPPVSPPPPPPPGGSSVVRRWTDFDVVRRGDVRLLAAGLLAGIAFDVMAHVGFASLAGSVFVTLVAAALLMSGRARSRQGQALLVLALLLSMVLVCRSSSWVILPSSMGIALLLALGASFAAAGPLRSTFPGLAARLVVAAGHVGLAPGMIRGTAGDDGNSTTPARVRAIARGLGLALPVVLVIGMLLGSADPVFQSWFDPSRLLRNLVLVAVGAWILVGLARAMSATRPIALLPLPPRLGTVEVVSVLSALSALYATFVAAQLAALTGGAAHVLSTNGLTYAEYARSGFFQLLAAAAITVAVVLSLRACADRTRTSVIVVSEVTIALTLGIVVVAIRRLQLYEDAYGLTLLRLASTVTATWIGLVLLLLAATAVRRRSDGSAFAPTVVLSGVLVVAIWAAANPAAVVARTNIERSGSGASFDVDQAVDLGPDAIPTLVAGLDELTPSDATELRRKLCAERRDDDGPGYNRSMAEADTALAATCPDRDG
jgi:two-component system sensor histidine kinase BaeS